MRSSANIDTLLVQYFMIDHQTCIEKQEISLALSHLRKFDKLFWHVYIYLVL